MQCAQIVLGGGGVVGGPKCTRTVLIQPIDFISQPTWEENKGGKWSFGDFRSLFVFQQADLRI